MSTPLTGAAPISIVQLGLGGVGQALLDQYLKLSQAGGDLFPLRYLAVADRSGLCIAKEGWNADDLQLVLKNKADGRSLAAAARELGPHITFVPHTGGGLPSLNAVWHTVSDPSGVVVVDVTAERGSYDTLLDARKHGAGIVMCNKWTLAESMERADTFLSAGSGRLFYETTVGAALPVIKTLDDLLRTGDTVSAIEAAISGTLGYVCSRISDGAPFSEALREAQALGYTEPDPRDDLAGIDARRKALILARKLGHKLNMEEINVVSLVPQSLQSVSLDEFWRRLPEYDAEFQRRVQDASERGAVLRYLARIDNNGASVSLQEAPRDSLAGSLRGTESLFVFHTARYSDQPLAVRGRGAGADITASGVMSDLLTIADNPGGRA